MLKSLEKIQNFCVSIKTEAEFSSDEKTFDACVRNLQILGDAAKHIPAQVQKKYPEVPWKEIIGLRNIVVHEYYRNKAKP